MTLPIHVYGDPVLRDVAEPVEADSEGLQALVDDMLETMHGAAGIGLAAPQVGRTERLFVVDLSPLLDGADEGHVEGVGHDHDSDAADLPSGNHDRLPSQPMVFINPVIEWSSDETCDYEEGCLSIPDLRETVVRPDRIRIRYLDRSFSEQVLEAGDLLARVIQHEYDHLDGVLFVDRITPFRRRLMQRRLREMARGEVEADYPLATPVR